MADVSVPTTPTNPDLREQIALAIALGYQDEAKYYLDEADQAMSVVAPVLEGLRAELDAMSLTFARAFRALERRDKEITNLRADRDKERESRIAWALEADRLDQVAERATHLAGRVLSEFIQKGYPGGPSVRTGWVGADTVAAWHRELAELSRPSVSDQTPTNPDDTAARHMADVTRHPRFAELYAQAAHNVRARDNHDQGDDAAPSSVQGDTTPEAACVHGQTADLTGLAAREDTR